MGKGLIDTQPYNWITGCRRIGCFARELRWQCT